MKILMSMRLTGVAGAMLAIVSSGASATTDPTETKNSTQTLTSVIAPLAAGQTANIIGGAVSAGTGGGTNTGGLGGPPVARFGLTGQAAAGGAPKWNGWLAFSQSKVGYTPLSASGTVDVTVAGVDYALSNTVLVGIAVAGDRSRVNTNFNGGSLNGNGYTISPYIGVSLSREFSLDATVGFGRTKNDINAGLAGTGTFTDRRTMGSIGLTYRRASTGPWLISGRGALLTVSDKLGAYTLSGGGLVPDGTVNITQMRLSGQLGYRAGAVTPYVGLTYIYDINRPTNQPIAGQPAPVNDRDAWTPSVGLRFNSGGALYGGIQYSSEQSRSQVKNNQVLLNLGIRF